ncbi:unnamed protein product [Trichogramma brassicae]|uniref:Uncharacterized protein n=1 Tax=Trichogramma brassicae TaxID=86971 RepID=A0A6H5IYJ4_9HYME|nr:unnamed protein product [Trichogramma brassicae]
MDVDEYEAFDEFIRDEDDVQSTITTKTTTTTTTSIAAANAAAAAAATVAPSHLSLSTNNNNPLACQDNAFHWNNAPDVVLYEIFCYLPQKSRLIASQEIKGAMGKQWHLLSVDELPDVVVDPVDSDSRETILPLVFEDLNQIRGLLSSKMIGRKNKKKHNSHRYQKNLS